MDSTPVEQMLGTAQRLIEEGRDADALPMASAAAELAPIVWADNPGALAVAYNTLAEVHRRLGRFDEAEPLYRRVLSVVGENGTAPNAEGAATVTTNLALLYFEHGDPTSALPIARDAVELQTAAFGIAHPAVENALRLLAAVHAALDDARGELAAHVQELDSRNLRLGSFDPDVLDDTNALSVHAYRLGDIATAEKLATTYLALIRVANPRSIELAIGLENLAHLHADQQRHGDAATLLAEALEVRRALQGDDSHDVTVALEQCAEAMRAAGDVAGAVPLLEDLVERRRGEADEMQFARSLNNLGAAHFTLGQLFDAKERFEEALAVVRRVAGDQDLNTARATQSLVAVLQLVGEYGPAESGLLDALQVLRASGEAGRADVATALVNLAGLYTTTDRPAAAEATLREAVEIRTSVFGDTHPATLDTVARLANLVAGQGRATEAFELVAASTTLAEIALDADHPTLQSLHLQLARLLRMAGRPDEARTFLTTVVDQLAGHREAMPMWEALSSLEEAEGNLTEARAHAATVVDLRRRLAAQPTDLADGIARLADLDTALGHRDVALSERDEVVTLRREALDADPAALADSLTALGDLQIAGARRDDARASFQEAMWLHHGAGRPGAAVPVAQRLLDLARYQSDGASIDVVAALNQLAELHRLAGDPAASVPLLEEALVIADSADDADEHGFAGILANNLGLAFSALGDYPRARVELERALAIHRALGEPTEALAFALNNLSAALDGLGETDAADRALDESLDVRRQVEGASSAVYASALLNRGIRHLQRGDLATARPDLDEAYSTLHRQLGDNHPTVAVALNALGFLHRRLGHYEDAETLLRLALSIQRAALNADDPRLGYTLDNLAGVLQVRGDARGADRLFRQAIALLSRQAGSQRELATALNNYGQLLMDVGRLADAERTLSQALSISEQGHDDLATATAANNLGLLRSRTGGDALPLLQRALELREHALGDDSIDVAQSRNNVGAQLHYTNPARARTLLEQSLDTRRRILGPDHPDVAESANNLSFHVDDPAQRIELLENAVRIRRLAGDTTLLADSLSSLAYAYVVADQAATGLSMYRESASIRDRLIARLTGLATEAEQLAYLTTVRVDLALFVTAVRSRMMDLPEAIRLAFELVMRRKAMVVEGLVAQRAAVLGGRYPSLRAQLAELDDVRAEIARAALNTLRTPVTAVGDGDRVAALEQRRDDLELTLAAQVPELDISRRLRTADTAAVAAALPADSVLLEYVRVSVGADGWYGVFALPASDPDALRLVDLGADHELDDLIASFRAGIIGVPEPRDGRDIGLAASGDGRLLESVGRTLRERLFDPLAPHLRDCRRLFVSPDGELTRLPLEVLPLDAATRLIDRYTVSYLGAGRDLLGFEQPRVPARSPAMVIADPDYDLAAGPPGARSPSPPGLHFARLAGTRQEGVRIAAMLGVDPILGADAMESTLSTCAGPAVLHIATHGYFLPDSGGQGPASSASNVVNAGLALAGVNTASRGDAVPDGVEDGMVTVDDLAAVDLLGTRLVVLSACETGLGRVQIGEGVFGLRRAITMAGAETLVMSLWKVPDLESAELMEQFYANVLAGGGTADALRAAQLAIKQRQPHPFFWGAFICQGAVAPAYPTATR